MSNITLLLMDLIAAEACNTTNNVRKSPRSANGRARVFQFYQITTVLFLRSSFIDFPSKQSNSLLKEAWDTFLKDTLTENSRILACESLKRVDL